MTPRVSILLCTYNGERFLSEQLKSYESQTFNNWDLWVSDDNSTDATVEILKQQSKSWPHNKLSIISGPSKGFSANFLSLVCSSSICSDYYAYSDQDDIWEPEKLARALSILSQSPSDKPTLYCARTCLMDDEGSNYRLSPLRVKAPSFSNALVENIAGGNTMVFNRAARDLVLKAGAHVNVQAHDWWTYIAVAACGGVVIYDPIPNIRYRQHGGNLQGSGTSVIAKIISFYNLMRGDFKIWVTGNINALKSIEADISQDNIDAYINFCQFRDEGILKRIKSYMHSKLYRQTFFGGLGLFVAVIFKRL